MIREPNLEPRNVSMRPELGWIGGLKPLDKILEWIRVVDCCWELVYIGPSSTVGCDGS